MFTTSHFGTLDHPRAGARILLRVRIRLVEMWAAEQADFAWRMALDDAIRWVDWCLDKTPFYRRGQ